MRDQPACQEGSFPTHTSCPWNSGINVSFDSTYLNDDAGDCSRSSMAGRRLEVMPIARNLKNENRRLHLVLEAGRAIMSSPMRPAKDLDPLLIYAPPWSREKPPSAVPAAAADESPIERPPQSNAYAVPWVRRSCGDLAVQGLRRWPSLDPEPSGRCPQVSSDPS